MQHYNLRKKRAPKYSHMKTFGYVNANVKTISYLNSLRAISISHEPNLETTMMTHCILLQYATKKGINIGERDIRSCQKELDKLHKIMDMQPRLYRDMTDEHKRRDISYVMFLKKKRYGLTKEGGG